MRSTSQQNHSAYDSPADAISIAHNGSQPRELRQLSELGQRLGDMLDPGQIVPSVTSAVCAALKAPYSAIYLGRLDTHENELIGWHGEQTQLDKPDVATLAGNLPAPPIYILPIEYHKESLGALVIDVGDATKVLDQPTLAVLRQFLADSAAAMRIVQLMEDLRRARERVVLAREEERQRLRRNLHDGIGPTLAALLMRSGTLRKLVGENPAQAELQLGEYREQLKMVITEIRRVVYNLRPPALDEIGMLRAIREQASQFSNDELQVVVDAPDTLPVLHPAVEVAAYRIACEAIANVSRHAQARSCQVHIRVDETAFLIEIDDDGIGISPARMPGVGLASMRERTSELGGTLVIETNEGRGTRVRACLPMGLSAWADLEAASNLLNRQFV